MALIKVKMVIKAFFQPGIRNASENEGCVYQVMVIGHGKINENIRGEGC